MSSEPKPEMLSRNVLLILLVICLAALVAVVFLVVRSGDKQNEQIITLMETTNASASGVNILQVVDTLTNKSAVAMEGHRYKVLIDDEAREGTSGIARIGGLVTFVPDARKGDVVIIEITRMKQSTADSVVIEKLEAGQAKPATHEAANTPPAEPPRPRAETQTESAMVGKIFRATVTDNGREGDGIVRIDNKVVFVKGAAKGEHVEFKVTEDIGRFARAEIISKSDTPYENVPAVTSKPKPSREPRPAPDFDKPVKVGEEHVVTITEKDRRNPDVDGVARVDGFVIFVPGTRVGDQVRVRITDMSKRAADAEVIERLEAEPATP